MHNTAASLHSALHFGSGIAQDFDHSTSRQPLTNEDAQDHQFVTMLDAYRDLGGLVRLQEVFTICKSRAGRDIASMARRIAKKDVLSFDWHAQVWIPLFQFDRDSMVVQPGFASVLAILNANYTRWSIALWFAKPNAWLQGATPASMLCKDAGQVLAAARARRLSSV